ECNKSSEVISEILKQVSSVCCVSSQLEAADCDPLDELYDALAEVLGAEEDTECYKTYLLPCGAAVSLSESVALILGGTTGLVTWEAALHLTEWALDHQQTFRGRTVLELGSGVGLTGIAHLSILDNVDLNGLDEQTVRVEELDWSTVTDEQLRAFGADTVIAAGQSRSIFNSFGRRLTLFVCVFSPCWVFLRLLADGVYGHRTSWSVWWSAGPGSMKGSYPDVRSAHC
uniref:Eukaryotic elongation factor 2 lysine methyltransferase n=1 Tax=Sphaeramia orbicularis TaxID=375764 RepID=A0A672YKV3_9TELE